MLHDEYTVGKSDIAPLPPIGGGSPETGPEERDWRECARCAAWADDFPATIRPWVPRREWREREEWPEIRYGWE